MAQGAVLLRRAGAALRSRPLPDRPVSRPQAAPATTCWRSTRSISKLAKIRETVTEPMLGRIRLQWWRENPRRLRQRHGCAPHAVAEPLAETVRRHHLPAAQLQRLIAGREHDHRGRAAGPIWRRSRSMPPRPSSTLVELALTVLDGGHPRGPMSAGAPMSGSAHALAGLPARRAVSAPAMAGSTCPRTCLDEAGFARRRRQDCEGRRAPDQDPARDRPAGPQHHIAEARRHRRQVPRPAPCRHCCRPSSPSVRSSVSRRSATTRFALVGPAGWWPVAAPRLGRVGAGATSA